VIRSALVLAVPPPRPDIFTWTCAGLLAAPAVGTVVAGASLDLGADAALTGPDSRGSKSTAARSDGRPIRRRLRLSRSLRFSVFHP
jgi:hypothetical protein